VATISGYPHHIHHFALSPQNVLFLFSPTLMAELMAEAFDGPSVGGLGFPLLESNGWRRIAA
jgi:hypothetical protein